MTEQTYRKLNPAKAIEEALPKIIEAFVMYYGEEERKNTEEKFKSFLFIGYAKPEDIERIIRDDNKLKSQELIEELLNKLNIPAEQRESVKKYTLIIMNLHTKVYNQYIIT